MKYTQGMTMDMRNTTAGKTAKQPRLEIGKNGGQFTLHRLSGGQIDTVREIYSELFPHRTCGVGDEKLPNRTGEVPTQAKLVFVGNFQSPEEVEPFLTIIRDRTGLEIHKPFHTEAAVRESLKKAGVKLPVPKVKVRNTNPDQDFEFEPAPRRMGSYIEIPHDGGGKFVVHSLSGSQQGVLRDIYAELFDGRPCGTSDEKIDGKYTFPSTVLFSGTVRNCQEALSFMQMAKKQGMDLGDINETLRQVANVTRPAKIARNIEPQGKIGGQSASMEK